MKTKEHPVVLKVKREADIIRRQSRTKLKKREALNLALRKITPYQFYSELTTAIQRGEL